MSPAFLFDVDGTLLRSGRAGREAMNLAFEALFGVSEAFSRWDFRGSLDGVTFREACARAGVEWSPAVEDAFRSRYLEELRVLLARGGPGHVLCPGVPAMLDELEALGRLGLVTGNWREGAELKLRAFGLWERFAFGAFGGEASERAELVALARRRAGGPAIVLGDAVADVRAARAAGLPVVALCTGWTSEEELRAAGPDLLLPDLERGREELLSWLDSGAWQGPRPQSSSAASGAGAK